MTKPQIKIVNVETGEEIVRDASTEEIAQIDLDAKQTVLNKVENESKATAKAALLKKLGITEAEAELLLA